MLLHRHSILRPFKDARQISSLKSIFLLITSFTHSTASSSLPSLSTTFTHPVISSIHFITSSSNPFLPPTQKKKKIKTKKAFLTSPEYPITPPPHLLKPQKPRTIAEIPHERITSKGTIILLPFPSLPNPHEAHESVERNGRKKVGFGLVWLGLAGMTVSWW